MSSAVKASIDSAPESSSDKAIDSAPDSAPEERWQPAAETQRVSGARAVTWLFVIAALVFFGMIAARYRVRGANDAAMLKLGSVAAEQVEGRGPELASGEARSVLHAALADAAPGAAPSYAQAVSQARAALSQQQAPRAIELARWAVRLAPERAESWLLLSDAHRLEGNELAEQLALRSCVQSARDAALEDCRARQKPE